MAYQILFFGGTFDPVHAGHLQIARALGEAVQARKVLLVPTGVNPLKSPPAASAEDRLAMLKLAVAGEDLFEICTLELKRTPPIYTIETIEILQKQLGPDAEIHLALGADMLADLPKWHRVTELLGMVHLVVAGRPPMTTDAVKRKLSDLAESMKKRGLEHLHAKVVATEMRNVSSTEIRKRISEGNSTEDHVNKKVMDYIFRKGLYRNGR